METEFEEKLQRVTLTKPVVTYVPTAPPIVTVTLPEKVLAPVAVTLFRTKVLLLMAHV